MAVIYIDTSKEALDVLQDYGFTRLGPSKHQGRYIEMYTVTRKWCFINGVVKSELITFIEDIPAILILPTAESVYSFVRSQCELKKA